MSTVPEFDELLEALADMDDSAEDYIKEVAMNRHNVKKGRRPHIRAILDEAFDMARERVSRRGR